MDEDLESLDREALIAEAKRLRAGVRAYRERSGYDPGMNASWDPGIVDRVRRSWDVLADDYDRPCHAQPSASCVYGPSSSPATPDVDTESGTKVIVNDSTTNSAIVSAPTRTAVITERGGLPITIEIRIAKPPKGSVPLAKNEAPDRADQRLRWHHAHPRRATGPIR